MLASALLLVASLAFAGERGRGEDGTGDGSGTEERRRHETVEMNSMSRDFDSLRPRRTRLRRASFWPGGSNRRLYRMRGQGHPQQQQQQQQQLQQQRAFIPTGRSKPERKFVAFYKLVSFRCSILQE